LSSGVYATERKAALPEYPRDDPIAFHVLRIRRALERLGFEVTLRSPDELLALWEQVQTTRDGEAKPDSPDA
jgi:hypothetical protein